MMNFLFGLYIGFAFGIFVMGILTAEKRPRGSVGERRDFNPEGGGSTPLADSNTGKHRR